jgi:hypothetical protein
MGSDPKPNYANPNFEGFGMGSDPKPNYERSKERTSSQSVTADSKAVTS